MYVDDSGRACDSGMCTVFGVAVGQMERIKKARFWARLLIWVHRFSKAYRRLEASGVPVLPSQGVQR